MPRFPAADRQPPMTLADAVGGPRGIIDSTIPTVAFVAVNAEAGLSAGIAFAIASAVALVVFRLVRREPVQQAISGLFAVAVAAFVASRTGSAEGYFLPSIAKNTLFTAVALGSVLVRRPLAGYVMAALDGRYRAWRHHPDLRRAAVLATFVWVVVFGLRVVVQGVFYLAGNEGLLAAANLALGLPLFGAALLATFAIVRRTAPRAAPPDAAPAAAGEQVRAVEGEVVGRAEPGADR
jgi:hypothetical protein